MQHFVHTALGHLRFQYRHRFLGLCTATVPSPSNRRCTRTDRQAIARNITFSKPGVVVALVLKPNSSLMDSMAVTWLSPGSTSLCTSLAILWQIALISGVTVNVALLRILVSLASVKSSRIYRATSAGTSGGASVSSSPFASAPKTSSIGLSGAAWAVIFNCGVGGCAAIALARSAASSYF